MEQEKIERQEPRRTYDTGSGVKTARVLYIISTVLGSPLVSMAASMLGIGNRYMIALVSLRMFFIPQICFAALTILYIHYLRKENHGEGEFLLFGLLFVLQILWLIRGDVFYTAAMGI